MVQRWFRRSIWCDGQAVQVTFQNRFHALVGAGLESDRALRRRLQAPWGVLLLAEPQNAETGGDSDDVDQSFRFDADQIGAKRRRPLSV